MKTLLFCLGWLVAGSVQAADLPLIGGGVVTLPVTSLKAARFQATLHQQFDFSCGSAAVATLLTFHYGHPVSERQAFDAMLASGDKERIRQQGFSLLDMQRYLASLGFIADGYQQTLEKLAQAGLPAIVRIKENGYAHFVVIKGVQSDRVLLGDPASGTRAISRAGFEAIWQDRLLFVIHDWPGAAQFNLASDWRVAPQALPALTLQGLSSGMPVLPKTGSGNF